MRSFLPYYRLALPVVFAIAAASVGAPMAGCVGDEPMVANLDASAGDARASDTGASPSADAAADAGDPGDAGAQAADATADAARTFCQNTVAGSGVTDFFCADFDGVDYGSWTKVVKDDGGVLEKTSDVATSPPYALAAASVPMSSGGGSLVWSSASAANFKFATAEVQMNPAQLGGVVAGKSGSVNLIDIRTQSTSVTFSVARGGNVGGTTYTGYYLMMSAFGGAAAMALKLVPTALTPNVWTKVKLKYGNDGSVELSYNDVVVASDKRFGATDPSVKFTVGATGVGENAVLEQYRFDNAQLSVAR